MNLFLTVSTLSMFTIHDNWRYVSLLLNSGFEVTWLCPPKRIENNFVFAEVYRNSALGRIISSDSKGIEPSDNISNFKQVDIINNH